MFAAEMPAALTGRPAGGARSRGGVRRRLSNAEAITPGRAAPRGDGIEVDALHGHTRSDHGPAEGRYRGGRPGGCEPVSEPQYAPRVAAARAIRVPDPRRAPAARSGLGARPRRLQPADPRLGAGA